MKLAATLKSWFGASEISYHPAAAQLNSAVLSQDGKYSIDLQNVEDSLMYLGSFVIGAMEPIGAGEMAEAIKSIATCSVNLISGLANIVAERDSRNDAAEIMPTRFASSTCEASRLRIC